MSRATIIDERIEDDSTTTDLEATSFDEPTQEKPKLKAKPQEEDLPDKYQGKSVQEIVQMHQEAEKMLGRQSSEVGELRKVVDDFIHTQLEEKQQTPVQQPVDDDDDIDFFTDPKSAVSKAIENHPKIREAQEYTAQYKKQTALAQLQSEHPDMQKILGDAKFAEWIKASKYRTQMFVAADQEYDYDAANELFSLWKERNQMVKQTAKVERTARKQSLKAATTGTARGTAEQSRKKTYRRADIIKLMRTDPERYQSMSDEIFKAYAEGRVK